MAEQGKYIVFEGGEGVGKTTQTQRVASEIDAKLVREPGTTAVGEALRSVILDPSLNPTSKTEALLHAAQRAQLMEEMVTPTLELGTNVVADRSWVSSAAYQVASGLKLETVIDINSIAVGHDRLKPDLLILLDADPELIYERWSQDKDRYEKMDMGYHKEVRANFIDVCKRMGGTIINAEADLPTVSAQVDTAITAIVE